MEVGNRKIRSPMWVSLTSSIRLSRIHLQLLALMLMVILGNTGSLCSAFSPASIQSSSTVDHPLCHRRHSRPIQELHLKSDGLTPEERDEKIAKATKSMTAFTNAYLKKTDTTLCKEKSIAAVVIKGLAEHKVDYGTPLCPCRFYDDKEKEVKDGYWNCPCVPMREEKVCHCMLFLTEDNAFAGDSQSITVDEVVELSEKAK